MKPKIAFIEPVAHFNMFPKMKLPMVGLVYLATILKNAGFEVDIYSEHFKKIFNLKKKSIKNHVLDYDVYCISIMTASARRGYEIARTIRQSKPGARIIFGGSHASFMPQEALAYGDQVVVGEGEHVILDMIEGRLTDQVIQGRPVESLNELPLADFSLVKHMRAPRKHHAFPISTSRGCPYDCNFCSVTKMFGKKFRFRSAQNVIDEVKQRVRDGNRHLFFYDDNLMANRQRIKEILNSLDKDGVKFSWGAQARANITKDDELMELLKKTKCQFVLMGFESIDDVVLGAMNKGQNTQEIEEAIEKFKQYNIGIYAAFVFGNDEDKISSFGKTLKFCKQHNFLATQFTINTPLPGSELYEQISQQKRLITRDWNFFDTVHAVFKSKTFSPYELQMKTMWLWKQFYSFPKIVKNLLTGKAAQALLYLYLRIKVDKFILQNKKFFKRLKTTMVYNYD